MSDFLEAIRARALLQHLSPKTADTYVFWAKRYILYHQKRHPKDMGAREVEQFLTHLAVNEQVSASTQNQAFCALLFMYRNVVGVELEDVDALRAKRSTNIPVVMSREEVRRVLENLTGIHRLASQGGAFGRKWVVHIGRKLLVHIGCESLVHYRAKDDRWKRRERSGHNPGRVGNSATTRAFAMGEITTSSRYRTQRVRHHAV